MPDVSVLAGHVAAAADRLPTHLEERLLGEANDRYRRPSVVAKAALWLIFLWFPFLQPILAGMLEMFAESGSLHVAHGMYRIVSALSAAHLLAGFTVVVGIYVALLAAMYARCLRAVRLVRGATAGSSIVMDAVDDILVSQIAAPLAQPFKDRLERLGTLMSRLASLSN
jgi:hypothetical protein